MKKFAKICLFAAVLTITGGFFGASVSKHKAVQAREVEPDPPLCPARACM